MVQCNADGPHSMRTLLSSARCVWVTTGGEHQSVHHQQDSNAYLMRPLRLVVEKLTSQINGLLPRGYSAGRATVLQRPRTTPRRQTLSQTESGALRSVPACLPACLHRYTSKSRPATRFCSYGAAL